MVVSFCSIFSVYLAALEGNCTQIPIHHQAVATTTTITFRYWFCFVVVVVFKTTMPSSLSLSSPTSLTRDKIGFTSMCDLNPVGLTHAKPPGSGHVLLDSANEQLWNLKVKSYCRPNRGNCTVCKKESRKLRKANEKRKWNAKRNRGKRSWSKVNSKR